ncbi:hypothetical protein [Olsenella intestinalis]|uniref:hypothetical protein n=1 Tax=Olsenella intestinalis TaxID=2930083 RepID=UPI00200D0569|nr:hypothetical protein [Olsenella intestinalis]
MSSNKRYRHATDASTDLSQMLHDPSKRQMFEKAGWDVDVFEPTKDKNYKRDFDVLHRRVQNPVTMRQAPNQNNVNSFGNLKFPKTENIVSADQTARGQVPSGNPDKTRPHTTNSSPSFSGVGPSLTDPFDPSDLETLKLVKRDSLRLVIALDTEFYYPNPESLERMMLTWQVAFADPRDPGEIHELVFASNNGERIGFGAMHSYIISRFGLENVLRDLGLTKCPPSGYQYKDSRRWDVPKVDTKGLLWADRAQNPDDWGSFTSFEDACDACGDPAFKRAYDELKSHDRPSAHRLEVDWGTQEYLGLAGYRNDYSDFHRDKRHVPITVLCHAGKADLSAFDLSGRSCEKDIMRRVSDVQGGLVTIRTFQMNPRHSVKWWRFYPLSVEVRDTMCYAPSGLKSLDALGRTIGVPKRELSSGYSKDDMLSYLVGDPLSFLDYASQDSLVTLGYAGKLFEFNRAMPVTASAAAASVAKNVIQQEHDLNSNSEFDQWFRGLVSVDEGMVMDQKTGKLRPDRRLEPLNDDCGLLQVYARQSYKGGLNGCSFVGWVDTLTHDLDLESAYLTAMALVFDIDWGSPRPIAREWIDEWMRSQDFVTPMDPIFAYVDRFEFPPDCPYPCIPIVVGGKPVYPLSLGERDGVYVTGVEIWLALQLGARVHVRRAVLGTYRTDGDGKPTRSLFDASHAFVRDRSLVKSHLGSQPELGVFEQLLKTMGNSLYGKTAQNVLEKSSWNALKQEMENMGCSALTSPTHCSMTTAIVRCTLLAAMNELDLQGRKTYSYTTDGMITDATADEVNGLTLFGLEPYLRAARMDLVGDGTVWAEKHEQDSFLNLTTRGNVAPVEGGVCAHNSYKSCFEKDSLGDRLHFLHICLTRTGRVECTHDSWPSFKDMSGKESRVDFNVHRKTRHLSMDFDLKRKPDESSVVTVHPSLYGETYEVANVETLPYKTPEEFEWWYKRGRSCRCLRTEGEWRTLFGKVRLNPSETAKRNVRDWDWSRIMTCVMGHRLGVWRIPTLDDPSLTVDEKCDWINTFNESKTRFKKCNWKNANKQQRQSQMLPREDVIDLLKAMGAEGF